MTTELEKNLYFNSRNDTRSQALREGQCGSARRDNGATLAERQIAKRLLLYRVEKRFVPSMLNGSKAAETVDYGEQLTKNTEKRCGSTRAGERITPHPASDRIANDGSLVMLMRVKKQVRDKHLV